jgi:hypothetical protein
MIVYFLPDSPSDTVVPSLFDETPKQGQSEIEEYTSQNNEEKRTELN